MRVFLLFGKDGTMTVKTNDLYWQNKLGLEDEDFRDLKAEYAFDERMGGSEEEEDDGLRRE